MRAFFDHVRSAVFGRPLTQGQVDGINALLDATLNLPVTHRAYLLATAFHETARTMQPIREYGQGKGRKYGEPGPHGGQVGYGRGYVQLTWPENYVKADKALDLDGRLIEDYDLALDPQIAALILVRGCVEGWFTGRKLNDYLPGDYVNARRVVNGTDRAHQIARYASSFEEALRLAEKPQEAEPVPAPVVVPVEPEPRPEPAPETLDPEGKSPVASLGVWGGVVAALAGVAGTGVAVYGFTVTEADVNEIAALIAGLVSIISGAGAAVGRIKATKQIK